MLPIDVKNSKNVKNWPLLFLYLVRTAHQTNLALDSPSTANCFVWSFSLPFVEYHVRLNLHSSVSIRSYVSLNITLVLPFAAWSLNHSLNVVCGFVAVLLSLWSIVYKFTVYKSFLKKEVVDARKCNRQNIFKVRKLIVFLALW